MTDKRRIDIQWVLPIDVVRFGVQLNLINNEINFGELTESEQDTFTELLGILGSIETCLLEGREVTLRPSHKDQS